MQTNKQAFTFIELLVVMLIIGILATVALPQYQAAVDKSAYSELMTLARSLRDQQELFYLEYGYYAVDCAELSPDIPNGGILDKDNNIEISEKKILIRCNNGGGTRVFAEGPTSRYGLFFSKLPMDFSKKEWAGKQFCSPGEEPRSKKLCKSFGGEEENWSGKGVNMGIAYFF